MQEDFLPPGDAEQRARRCILRGHLPVADARITALLELLQALRVKFNENYRAGVGLDGDLTEILKSLDDPSNLRHELAIGKVFGVYSDLEVPFLICARFVCGWGTAASSLG